ncbi:MAG: hypothetical protein GX210_09270 [Firmicutes bacterium]|nr:hypothetical protein [Bacillota bacterium]
MPLTTNPLTPLPLGAVKPTGWLRATLCAQKDGLTGLLDQVPPRRGAGANPVRSDSVWLGGEVGGDFILCRSERAPYYVRGLVALAYVLRDRSLMEKAQVWLDYWFAHQGSDGQLRARGVSDYEWWPRMLILDAVRLYYEATRDQRALVFAARYFNFQLKHLARHPFAKNLKPYPDRVSWSGYRAGDNLDLVLWLYRHTGDRQLARLAEEIRQQSYPWEDYFLLKESPSCHGVNLAHGLRKPAVQYQLWPGESLLKATREGLRKTMAAHGQVSGSFSGDEYTHGRGYTQGTELCTIVELMRTYETLIAILGVAGYGDALERLAYNALPAAVAPDFRSHQYFSQPNQVYCTLGPHGFQSNKLDPPWPVGPWYRDALAFGAPSGYPCCLYNFHQGWPLFAASMWMAAREGGLAAVAYGPCRVETSIYGNPVAVEEKTAYPFDGRITLTVSCPDPTPFSLLLRVPGWCTQARARVGEEHYEGRSGSFLTIHRTWWEGDTVELELPMSPSLRPWDPGVAAVEYGPLVFAFNPAERWVPASRDPFPTYEVVPDPEKPSKRGKEWRFETGPSWNYALPADASLEICRRDPDPSAFPWTPEAAPLFLRTHARRLPEWGRTGGRAGLNAGPPPVPLSAGASSGGSAWEEISLVPYGCARLRISMFPLLEQTPEPEQEGS